MAVSSRLVVAFLGLAAGTLGGALAGFVAGGRDADAASSGNVPAKGVSERAGRGARSEQPSRAFEARAPVGAPLASAAPASPPDSSQKEENQPIPTAQENFRAHEKKVSEHFTDGRDEAWASRTETSLRGDFDSPELGLNRFVKVVGVDCRMTSCVATVEWNDRAVAHRSWQELIHTMYSASCATSVSLPPDDGAEQAPLRARLLFDCTELRAAQL
jgi:hypothetical protein